MTQKIHQLKGAPRIVLGKKHEITRDQINSWNRLVNEVAGTKLWHRFVLCKEYKNNTRWVYLTHNASIRASYLEQAGEKFYLKPIKNKITGENDIWLYWENANGTDAERWLLNDLALDFFGYEEV